MKINNRILIVDDNIDIHADFRKVLSSSKLKKLNKALYALESSLFEEREESLSESLASTIDYEIDSAYQGREALDMIVAAEEEGRPYAVVFTDVRMPPGLDGVQLVTQIWKKAPYTEIVIMTAFSDYSWEEMTEEIGLTDRLLFLRKPFDILTVKQIALTLTKKWTLGALARKRVKLLSMNQQVVDRMKDAVLWLDEAGTIFSVNETACHSLGYSREELLTLGIDDIGPEFSRDNWRERWRDIRKHGSELVELSFQAKDGRTFPVEIAFSGMEFEGQEFICAVARDITERKLAEQKLASMEERWRFLWENVPDNILEMNADGGVMITNFALPGLAREQMIGLNLFESLPRDQSAMLRKALEKARKTGQTVNYEIPASTPEGATWRSERVAPVKRNGDAASFLLITADITERKRAEQALRESEDRLAEAQRIARLGNWEWRPGDMAMTWSQEMRQIFGVDASDFSPTIARFKEFVHPEDRPAVDQALEATLRDNEPFRVDCRIVTPDGKTRCLYASAKTERDSQGKPIRLIGIVQDITERRQVELERASLESQLQHSQKMETIGTLAGGIAHDFNNILTPILGYTEMALENATDDSDTGEDLEQILKAANRAKDLVQQILTFSRQVDHERRPVQIELVVNDAIKLIRAWLPTTIEIRPFIEKNCGSVLADPTQLHQVLMNLATNAFHAMDPGSGALEISLRQVNGISDRLARVYPKLKDDKLIHLSVRDQGRGMDPQTLDRIFEPFYTTKPVGEGTGLGLSVVHGIVASMNGVITVESDIGKGSVFHIYFPLAANEAKPTPAEKEKLSKGKERILFVDDEATIAAMGKEMLRRLGYEVTVRTNGKEALELFQTNPNAFDLVITDQTMPLMTGSQLAQELTAIRKELPVILISGFSESLAREQAGDAGIFDYIQKPIHVRELNSAIRRSLSRD